MSALSRRQCLSVALTVLVITSSFVPGIEAGRFKGGSRKGGGGSFGSSSSKSKGRTQTQSPQRAPNQSNVALSYPTNYQPARPAVAPSAPKPPSAPQAPANTNNQPIGWKVGGDNNAHQGGAGIQRATATQNNNAPPAYNQHPQYPQQPHYNNNPPPYSAQHPNGPPPAYNNNPYQQSPYGHQGAAPPAYTPNGHGYPQQPNYHGGQYPNAGVGYPQQPGYGGGFGGGYPQQGGFGGGYGGGGFGGGHPPVINNYYQQKSSGGLGLTNALLLGVGGLSLYNAFKPGETKIIYVNNSTNPEDARQVTNNGTHVLVSDNTTTVATPLAPFPDNCAQYMNMPYPPVPLAPLPEETTTGAPVMDTTTLMGNATEGEATTPVPLAPLPGTEAVQQAPVQNQNQTENTTPVATTPQIPQECVPFVTGQVLPLNYTGPAQTAPAFSQPNPNIQYANPSGYNGQPPNTVDATGAKTSGGQGLWEKVSAMTVLLAAVGLRAVIN